MLLLRNFPTATFTALADTTTESFARFTRSACMRIVHPRRLAGEARMRTTALALACLMFVAPLGGCLDTLGIGGGDGGGLFDDESEPLRINHIQVKGTHNSYHIEPFGPTVRAYDYTHEPLDVQAREQGVRQFEIDVWWDPRGELYVYHNQYDVRSNCVTFEDCLTTLLGWSEENPTHVPLMIWVEPKEWVQTGTDLPTVIQLQDMLGKIEEEIGQFWPRQKTITPDDVRGQADNLSAAVMEDGWPLLEESRGKAIFILLAGGEVRDDYLETFPGLDGSLMFTMSQEGTPTSAIFSNTDPVGNGDDIRRLVEVGYIVRTRADDTESGEADNNDTARFMAAVSVGAQSISTDYPAKVDGIDYWIEIPNGTPVACNPLTAPTWCTSEDIESLG